MQPKEAEPNFDDDEIAILTARLPPFRHNTSTQCESVHGRQKASEYLLKSLADCSKHKNNDAYKIYEWQRWLEHNAR